MSTVTIVAAVLIALGLVGVVVPLLPGVLLILAGIGYWAFQLDTRTGWVVLIVAGLVLLLGQILKYVFPSRRMRDAGVPWSTLAFGALLGLIGFFVIPVLGLFLGFVLGVYLAEMSRLGSTDAAWPSTKSALKAIGLSVLIELAAGLVATAVWGIGVVVS